MSILEYILILNCFCQWIVLYFLCLKRYNFRRYWLRFKWNTTFFGEIRYGFRIMLWKGIAGAASGKAILSFDWAENVEDRPYIYNEKDFSIWARPNKFFKYRNIEPS